MRNLAIDDLELVSGGVGPVGAAVAGVAAGAEYIASSQVTGDGSVSGFVVHVGGATIGGALFGPAGGKGMQAATNIILGATGGTAFGAAKGQAENILDAAGTNYQN